MSCYYEKDDAPAPDALSAHAPELFAKYYDYQNALFSDGALDQRTKWLIGFAVAFANRCPYCIEAYSEDCLNLGFTKEELTEAMMVAAAAQGGAIHAHGAIMQKVFDRTEE